VCTLKVVDLAATDTVLVAPGITVAEAAALVKEKQVGAIALKTAQGWFFATAEALNAGTENLEDILRGPMETRTQDFLQEPLPNVMEHLVRNSVIVPLETGVVLFTPDLMIKKLVAAYRLLQVRFQTVLDTVGEAVCVIDNKDSVVQWNRRSEQLYGIEASEIVEKPLEHYFPDSFLSRVMKERQAVKEQYYRPRPRTHVLFTANAIRLDGEVVGALCAERDITEIVQLNQELSKASMEVRSLKDEIDKITFREDAFSTVCGHSTVMVNAVSTARKVAAANIPVLLQGESGTGKEIFARAIHKASRRAGPFIEINCGAIPVNLFESELFGYQAGAFTGADRKGKQGLMELANHGTLFLDELGDLAKELQVKLLKAIEEKSFYRVGGDRPVKVDVRIIAATHRNLEQMITQREFREDLYYRLNVVNIVLVPLRERREDIPELVHRAIKHFGILHNKEITRIEPDAMAILLDYHWPGNVRELYNVLERIVVFAETHTIDLSHLPGHLQTISKPSRIKINETAKADLNSVTDAIEKDMIEAVLKDVGNQKAAAAKKLGIPRSTLYYKINQLGIEC